MLSFTVPRHQMCGIHVLRLQHAKFSTVAQLWICPLVSRVQEMRQQLSEVGKMRRRWRSERAIRCGRRRQGQGFRRKSRLGSNFLLARGDEKATRVLDVGPVVEDTLRSFINEFTIGRLLGLGIYLAAPLNSSSFTIDVRRMENSSHGCSITAEPSIEWRRSKAQYVHVRVHCRTPREKMWSKGPVLDNTAVQANRAFHWGTIKLVDVFPYPALVT